MRKRITILLIFFFVGIYIYSANGSFKILDNTQGLPDNTINCISQDKHGFIWIGTFGGLCRYDGLSLSVFKKNPNNIFSIINDNVHKILPVNTGLYLATDKGLDFYSFRDGLFHQCSVTYKGHISLIKSRLNSIIYNKGNILAADENGILYIKKGPAENCQFERVNNHNKIYVISNSKNQNLVAIGHNKLFILSSDARQVYCSYVKNIDITYNLNLKYSKNTDLVYFGNGIGHKGLAFKIINQKLELANDYVPDNLMDVIDYKNKTVFAVDGGGIIIKDSKKIIKYIPENSNISGDAAYSLFADNNNKLWIGTYRFGVNVYSEKQSKFEMLDKANHSITYDIVTAVLADKENIFIGLDGGGLNIYNVISKKTKSFTTFNSNIAGNNVLSILKDKDDIWMAIYTKGLARYSMKKSCFKLYSMPSFGLGDENNVWTMCDDGLGNIWVGGPNMCVFNKKTEKLHLIKSLIGVNCSSVQRKGNYIYIGSNHNGIYIIDRRNMKIFRHYTSNLGKVRLPGNGIRYMYVDSHNTIWISVSYYGLYSIDFNTNKIIKHDYNEGLTNSNVVSIAEDKDGLLWMGTLNGLFRYDRKAHTFARFDIDESISSIFTYNASLFYGNTMFLGSTKGLVSFNPTLIRYRQCYRNVSITSLELLNNDKKIFNLYGGYIKDINLDYEQNFFTIHFSVPEFDAPNRIYFSYYLKGLENGWRELSGAREVSYTNVPPGKYDFYVRCTDSNGNWLKPTVFHIIISPPWWKTTLASIIGVLLILIILSSALKFYLYELEIKHNMRINEIEKDTMKKLNDAKMTFYTNIIHELRTPVFLISAQIEELLDIKKSIVSVPSSYLYAMYRSSAKLNKLISRIIDFRKVDSDKLKLALQRMNVVGFCENLIEDFTNLCEQKNISFNFVCDKSDIELEFDTEKLEMIISNLVSNAFKYTKEGGRVTLTIEEKDDEVIFSVMDNGIGIVEKMRDNIFESFFRSERAEKQSTGDGIGLSVVKSFVELHGGSIKVDSNVGKGSNFIFSIPKNINESGKYIKQDLMPFEVEDNIELKPIVPQLPENPMATHTILIIDDEQQTIDLLERNLISDFKVYKAYDGIEGLKQAEKVLPDIIICDIMMPNMDGLQFLTKLKSDKKLSNIKVLIFTAKTSEEDMLTAFDNGADAYITKPISLKVLRKRIDNLIEQTDNAKLTNSITEKDNSYTKEEQIFLLKCREIIDDNINNNDFNIDFLADKLAMSHSSLYKKIKQMTGMSLIEFINDYKIYKSVQLFKQGLTNIESVCEKCGFKDVKNFREMFKRKMKITPKQYVQSL